MRLLLVLCVTVLVGLFLALAFAALAPACHNLIVAHDIGAWCFPEHMSA